MKEAHAAQRCADPVRQAVFDHEELSGEKAIQSAGP